MSFKSREWTWNFIPAPSVHPAEAPLSWPLFVPLLRTHTPHRFSVRVNLLPPLPFSSWTVISVLIFLLHKGDTGLPCFLTPLFYTPFSRIKGRVESCLLTSHLFLPVFPLSSGNTIARIANDPLLETEKLMVNDSNNRPFAKAALLMLCKVTKPSCEGVHTHH